MWVVYEIHQHMKKIIILSAVALVLCSCGASRHVKYDKNDDPVNVGYGSVTKDDNNYSVSKLKVDKRQAMTYTDMYEYLRGRVPGVIVTSDNSIIIRGLSSNNQTEPLILVDGVETEDLSSVDPNLVNSVEVLKDGAASIYGVRGANGVILITLEK